FEGLVELTLQTSHASAHFRMTENGLDHARRSLEVCGYIGPAPVHLDTYAAMLRWQFAHAPQVHSEHVKAALSNLVLPEETVQLAGLAVSSGRSLFIYGPPGNGKSSLGRHLHAALSGDYWIPHCITVGDTIIRIFDEQCHKRVDLGAENEGLVDQRWIR